MDLMPSRITLFLTTTCRLRLSVWLVAISTGWASASDPAEIAKQIQDQPHSILLPDLSSQQIRQFSDWVQKLPGVGHSSPRSLLDAIQRLRRENPTANFEEIAQMMLREDPQLQSPERVEQLQRWLDRLQGNLPPGIPPSEPDSGRFTPEPSEKSTASGTPFSGLKKLAELSERWKNRLQGKPPAVPPPTPPDSRLQLGSTPSPGAKDPDRPAPMPLQRLIPEGGFLPEHMEMPASIDLEQLARRERQFLAVKQFWERHFGSLEQTPALRSMMLDLLTGENGMNLESSEDLFSSLADPNENAQGFLNWLDNTFGQWKLDSLNFPTWGLSAPDVHGTAPRLPRMTSQYDVVDLPGEFLLLGVWGVIAVVFIAWLIHRGGLFSRRSDHSVPGTWQNIAAWPIDPRQINDRNDLIRAFEHLTLQACGASARTWNHLHIAEAFARLLGGTPAAASARPLADWYALARYGPASEPFPPTALTEARRHLCEIVGVAAP